MTSTILYQTEQWIDQARAGDPLALGPLLESYAQQLRRIAERQLDDKLRGRISSSDIVQETLLQATRDFAGFRGVSDAEFGGWLRKILARKIAKNVERHVLTEKRDVRREVFMDQNANGYGSQALGIANQQGVVDQHPGPASEAVYVEREQQIDKALASLPVSYRQIVEMRNIQGLPFDEIAKRLNGTSGAARMRWLRAIELLRRQLNSSEST